MSEGHPSIELPTLRLSRELPQALHDLGEAGGGEGMATGLEAARRIDGEAAVEGGVTVERGVAGLAGWDEANVLQRDQLEGGEGVVELGEIHAGRRKAGHGEGRPRRRLGGAKAGEI